MVSYKLNIDNNKHIFIKFIEYMFVFITILQCNCIYMYSTPTYISKNFINFLWQFLLIILLLFSKKHMKYKDLTDLLLFITIFVILLISFFIYNVINYPSFNKDYIVKLLIDPILLLLCFYWIDNPRHLFTRFENVTIIISIFSLLFWLMYELHVPTNTSLLISRWGTTHSAPGYFNIYYLAQTHMEFLGLPWNRNSGIFVESSMFSYVLIVGLLIDLFVNTNRNKRILNYKSFILLITIISTASTTGIVVSLLAFIYAELISTKMEFIKAIFIFIIPFILLFVLIVIFTKLNQTGIYTSSIVRHDDIVAGFKAFINHPFGGVGLGNNNSLLSNMSTWRFVISQDPRDSSGLAIVLAQGGLFFLLFYLLPTLLSFKISKRIVGLAIFSFIPLIFVISQGFYVYIMIITYLWYLIINCYSKRVN